MTFQLLVKTKMLKTRYDYNLPIKKSPKPATKARVHPWPTSWSELLNVSYTRNIIYGYWVGIFYEKNRVGHALALPGQCYLMCLINRGSYMSAHVLLNLLNELGKRDKMRGLPSSLSLFSQRV